MLSFNINKSSSIVLFLFWLRKILISFGITVNEFGTVVSNQHILFYFLIVLKTIYQRLYSYCCTNDTLIIIRWIIVFILYIKLKYIWYSYVMFWWILQTEQNLFWIRIQYSTNLLLFWLWLSSLLPASSLNPSELSVPAFIR